MAEVVWVEGATTDLIGVVAYINQFDPDAAASMGQRLFELGESLSTFPRRGRPSERDTRELVTVPPYLVRYRVSDDGDRVTILSVRHGRQHPGTR